MYPSDPYATAKELEDENQRLRQLLQEAQKDGQETNVSSTHSSSSAQVTLESTQRQWSAEDSLEPPASSTREELASETSPSLLAEAPQMNQASYHGPTSVLFDNLSRLNVKGTDEDFPTSDSNNIRCMLVAESARQRQLETVNFATGALDFDGVEPSLGMELLSIYWTRQPHAGLIVYRTVFMRDMACGGPYFSKLLLNAMYYSASKHCSSTAIRHEAKDINTAGWSFRQRFTEILRDQFDQSRITSIQALLIMSSSLFSRCDERSVSWLYAGNAFNMLIDMGIHVRRGTSRSMSPEELEVRRRVFWGAFLIDKLLCLYQGRHPNLRLSDSNIPLVFYDDYEELEHFNPISFCAAAEPCVLPSYNLSLLEHFCRLSIVMERIHSQVYSTSHSTQPSDHLPNDIKLLQLELEEWRRELPPQLDFVSCKAKLRPLPYNLAMLATYNLLVILVFRLLLSHTGPSPGSLENEALVTCCRAASEISQILRIHEKLYNLGSETFVLCYAAHISATIHIHVLAHHGNQFGHREALAVCLGALDRHKAVYSSARRAREILHRLMADMGVSIEADAVATPAVTLPRTTGSLSVLDETLSWQGRHDGDDNSPSLSTLLEPHGELGFPDFDATSIMENLRGTSGISESWFNVSEQTMLWDVYDDGFQSTWDV
uniref:Xylanolytic transcriptional activator regulatory domain-containing protein n=1 Tax=Bionectria ochroleuca TaxID=29856 RepID=A0A8H7NHS4_BIOOC